jgi:hypothetical protein
MLTNADLTVYNKYVDAATRSEKYQRAVILAVAWENRKAANTIASGGQISVDSARIFIPYSRGINYLAARAWQTLTTKTGKWTFQIGDIIVKGAVTDEIHEAIISPPSAAFTISDLKAKYDDVLVISSVDKMDNGSSNMAHWQLGAK